MEKHKAKRVKTQVSEDNAITRNEISSVKEGRVSGKQSNSNSDGTYKKSYKLPSNTLLQIMLKILMQL